MSDLPPLRPAPRLLGLDQARAAAILAMLVAHFAPGAFVQLPHLDYLRVPVYAFARLATPTFVVVFGVTIGFVYLPRYLRRGPRWTAAALGRRAAVMLVCSVVIAVPFWVQLSAAGETDRWVWLSGLYSVLLFYALALVLLPAWMRWLCSAPPSRCASGSAGLTPLAMKCLLGGALLWAVGTAGHRLVPEGPPGAAEYARTVLASGSYAYFQLMGTALVAIPVGVWLRARWEAGLENRSLVGLMMVSLGLAVLGGLWGLAAGEYEPGPFLAGELRTPPRAWYFLHVGGVGLALVPLYELCTRALGPLRPLAYGFALFGQAGLLIYTGHVFVLPGLALVDRLTPLHGAARVVAALVPFLVFCAVVMYARHRRLTAGSRVRISERRKRAGDEAEGLVPLSPASGERG
jgi:hypothetical protein